MVHINENLVELNANASTAEDAIRLAGNLLVKEKKVEPSYVEAMVKGFLEIGPYIVLGPNIAIPHARPEAGVNETSLAFLLLKEPVSFGHPTNDPVKLVCVIGGKDNESHLDMLKNLSAILGDKKKLEGLLKARSKKEFISYL